MMSKQNKWIRATIQAADKVTVKLPWERGATRTAFIAKRDAKPTAKRASA